MTGPASSSKPASSGSQNAYTLIRSDELQPQGTKFFNEHEQKDEPFNIITVSGAQRTGKSFLLNYMMGNPEGFKVENMGSCTQGVDVFAKLLDPSDPNGIGRWFKDEPEAEQAGKYKIAMLDLEGTGDKGKQYDAKVMVAAYLVSQVIIFNANGQLGKAELLDQLGAIAIIGRMIRGCFEEGRLFGHLHIVFRNWQHTGLNEVDMMKYIMGTEGVTRNLTDEEVASVNARNFTRNIINECFASINVHCLPYPASPKIVEGHQALPFDLLEFQFVQKVKELMLSILPHLCETRRLQGQRLTPRMSVDVLGSVINQLKAGEEIKVDSIVVSLQESVCRRTIEEASAYVKKAVSEVPADAEGGVDKKAILEDVDKILEKIKDLHVDEAKKKELVDKVHADLDAAIATWEESKKKNDAVICEKSLAAGKEFLETEYECAPLDNELDHEHLLQRAVELYNMAKEKPVTGEVDEQHLGQLKALGKSLRQDFNKRREHKMREEEIKRKEGEWNDANTQLLKVNEHMIRSTNHLLEQRDEYEAKMREVEVILEEEKKRNSAMMKRVLNGTLEFLLREKPKSSVKQDLVTALRAVEPQTKVQILDKLYAEQAKGRRWRKRF